MPTYNRFILDDNRALSPRPLQIAGPTLQVAIAVPDSLAQRMVTEGLTPPPPRPTVALVDTGASRTCADFRLLEALTIQPVGVVPVYTPSGPAIQRKYPCTLSFPNTPLPKITFSSVIGSDLRGQQIGVLIGRDVLAQFVLIYNGPAGMYTLSF